MSEYEKYSKEELIRMIEELKAQNTASAAGDASQTASWDVSQTVSGDTSQTVSGDTPDKPVRFKEKYAVRILESLPDMLTVLSDQGTLVDLVSSDETNHVGVSAEELVGMNIRDMLTDEAYANVRANLDRVVETNEGSTSHHDITLEGVTHNYENRIFPLAKGYALCMCREVTEEVKAKEDLLQANRRMVLAEDIASLNHWYYYEKSREFEAPKIFPLLKGFAGDGSARFPKQEFLSYVHPADREKLLGQFRGELGEDPYVEYRLSIQGKTRYFHSRIIHSYQQDGELVVEGYAQDMTYLVERLHELEALKYALSNAAEDIFSCDLDGNLEFANLQFLVRNGIEGDISRYKLYELGPSNTSAVQWRQLVGRIRSNDGYYKFTTRFNDPVQGILVLEIASYIVYDPAKEKEVVWFFSRDISVRVAHETRVRELNQLMDAILNNVPVCLFVKDPGNEFRYLYWNKAFERDSGIPAATALGRTDFEIFPNPKDAEKFRQDDLTLLQRGETIQFEEQYQAVSGEIRTVFTSKILVPSENKLPLIIGVTWDITDMKNTQRQLVAARIKAEEADRLKSAFLANMSHEIRTPLNAIMGFSKLILAAEDEQEKQQYSEIIENNSELLLQLINDILDISKIEAGTLEFNYRPMCLGDLCRAQYETHKNRVKPGVTLVFEPPQAEVHLHCDYNRLAQVITNLINNAIKFTTSGEIRFGFGRRGDMVECFVSDTGIGIPERERKMIFDRFVKLNSHATGTGLGLAITKMIVEKIGGTIGVESEVNRGTTFRFTVPAVAENCERATAWANPAPEGLQPELRGGVRETAPAEARAADAAPAASAVPAASSSVPAAEKSGAASASAPVPAASVATEASSSSSSSSAPAAEKSGAASVPGGHRPGLAGTGNSPFISPEDQEEDLPKVLIAEDIDSNYMLMKAFIGNRYRLIWAHNGQEAVELFERHRPQLIFMDIKMPVMDGYEATAAIRRLSSEVPILAITAFAFESDRQKAMEAGCNDYITKPISREILNEKLSFYLG